MSTLVVVCIVLLCLCFVMFFRGLDVTPIMLALSGASAYPRACQALSSMLSRNALNPADITVVRHFYIILLPSSTKI